MSLGVSHFPHLLVSASEGISNVFFFILGLLSIFCRKWWRIGDKLHTHTKTSTTDQNAHKHMNDTMKKQQQRRRRRRRRRRKENFENKIYKITLKSLACCHPAFANDSCQLQQSHINNNKFPPPIAGVLYSFLYPNSVRMNMHVHVVWVAIVHHHPHRHYYVPRQCVSHFSILFSAHETSHMGLTINVIPRNQQKERKTFEWKWERRRCGYKRRNGEEKKLNLIT